ncbi:MAG: hypothetical protein MUO82_05620 [Candidatus Thermoplasmatota archaeon]|nr:hypothetical protein [Candidatus Thermoplasmatota archaeon]
MSSLDYLESHAFKVIEKIIGYRIYTLLRNIYVEMYVLNGIEKQSKKPLKVWYAGNANSIIYLSNILFMDSPDRTFLGNCFFWNISKKIEKYNRKVDLLLIKNDILFSDYFRKKGFTIIPEWVNFVLDVSDSIQKIQNRFHKSAKDDLRKLKKYDYSYEISKNKRKKDFFYYNMFLPYIKKVDTTSTVSILYYYKIKSLLRRCIILFVKDKDKYIAGGAIHINKCNNKIAYLTCMGILNGDKKYVEKSATTALLYYHIRWAKENDIEVLDFGHARPFLNDGLFRYKSKWGMIVRKSDQEFDCFAVKIKNHKEIFNSFIENNPVIFIEKSTLKVCIIEK